MIYWDWKFTCDFNSAKEQVFEDEFEWIITEIEMIEDLKDLDCYSFLNDEDK